MQLSIYDQNHDHDNFSTKLKHFNKVIITYQIRTRRMSLNQKIHETLDFCHKQYSSPHQLDHNPSSQHLLLHSNIDLRRRRKILRRKRFPPSKKSLDFRTITEPPSSPLIVIQIRCHHKVFTLVTWPINSFYVT